MTPIVSRSNVLSADPSRSVSLLPAVFLHRTSAPGNGHERRFVEVTDCHFSRIPLLWRYQRFHRAGVCGRSLWDRPAAELWAGFRYRSGNRRLGMEVTQTRAPYRNNQVNLSAGITLFSKSRWHLASELTTRSVREQQQTTSILTWVRPWGGGFSHFQRRALDWSSITLNP